MTVAHFKDDKMAALRAKERALATLALARPASLVQLDSGLLLLMCQLFMLSENADGRELLERTGDALLEEYAEKPRNPERPDNWARFRPNDGVPIGHNLNGQNLMHARTLLRSGGPSSDGVEVVRACATRLFDDLAPAIVGSVVMSKHAAEFYRDESITYAAMLAKAVPARSES